MNNNIPVSQTNLTGDRVRDLVAALLRLDQDAKLEIGLVQTRMISDAGSYYRQLSFDGWQQPACRACEERDDEDAFLQASLDAGNDAINELYKIRNALP